MTESEDQVYAQMRFGPNDDSIERLGIFVAWLVNHRLLRDEIEQSASRSVARVRLQDLTGSEFLSTVLHGDLRQAHLSERGNAFTRAYFVTGRFNDDLDEVSSEHHQKMDPWVRYDHIAPVITKAYEAWRLSLHPSPLTRLAKILPFRRK
ncbi:MAG: hypothetical protein O7G84_01605 [Gammaproteobacteria bacterium]|nr:hypothetical protein [Gammaproteobacteria bacterium]